MYVLFLLQVFQQQSGQPASRFFSEFDCHLRRMAEDNTADPPTQEVPQLYEATLKAIIEGVATKLQQTGKGKGPAGRKKVGESSGTTTGGKLSRELIMHLSMTSPTTPSTGKGGVIVGE